MEKGNLVVTYETTDGIELATPVESTDGRAYILWGFWDQLATLQGQWTFWLIMSSLVNMMTYAPLGWSWTVLDHADIPMQKGLFFLLCHGHLIYLTKDFRGFMIHFQF